MTQANRQRKIIELLEQTGELLVEQACQTFEASPATIRRDFNDLVMRGLAQKTWGGIIQNKSSMQQVLDMVPVQMRQEKNISEKTRIAAKAASLVQDGDIIMVDGGSTTLFMAPFLANKSIQIVTNSVVLALQIDKEKTTKQGAEVFVTGGLLYPNSGMLIGPQNILSIKNYKAVYAFISAGGLDVHGPSNNNPMVVEAEKAMMQQCDKTFLLADSSKYPKTEMCYICTWQEIDCLITTSEKPLEKLDVQTIMA